MAAVLLAIPAVVRADVPDASSGRLAGIYKVASSSDPIFPATAAREYFLDFGRGIQADKLSGSVAVSERRNPNVRVRILAWQYFPDEGRLVIGNPFHEGSRQAVVKASWQMKNTTRGVILERGPCQVVLHRADPKDY